MDNFEKKKSLGQNFLKDKRALQKIADTAEILAGETVLEIGPGEGALTELLLKKEAKVMAVEKDDRLIPILQKKFAPEISSGKLILVHQDILEFLPQNYTLDAGRYTLVANIPYYITGEIIRNALSVWPQPKKAVLLLQKEVAERIVAKDGKESILSISVKVFGEPKIAGIVKAGAFSPAPSVDSAILTIGNISYGRLGNLGKEGVENFFNVVKTGFAHKRKVISANLKPIFSEKSLEILKTCEIPPQSRAETIPLEKWLCLATEYINNIKAKP